MIPPIIPADFSYFEPKTLPIFTPKTENRKVVKPMIITDDHNFTWIQAKETPTAKASILVAMAKRNMVLKSKEPLFSPSSFLPQMASRIILVPIRKSKPKAIQWS